VLRIMIYSYFPPLANHLAGGAQRFLDGLLPALSRTGDVEIAVLCAPLAGEQLIPDQPGLRVIAELAVVDGDPTPAQAHHDLAVLSQYCRWADVVVTIDRHFPLPTNVPVVLCLNNFSYGPETRSVFGLGWDAIIVPSDYLRRCLTWYVGPDRWQGAPPPVHVIPYGISLQPATEQEVMRIYHSLSLATDRRYLAFPHRPEFGKGFETAVRATAELRSRGEDFTLLAPAPAAELLWPDERPYLDQRRAYVERHDAVDAVRFHRWIRPHEMSAYLAVAERSLCLSSLPEGFGLTVVEGLAAGTGVVATPAGAVPELVPAGHGVDFAEFDDAAAVAEAVAGGLSPDEVAHGQRFVQATYYWDTIAANWVCVLSTVTKRNAQYDLDRPDPQHMPPWLRTLPSTRVWDDYRMSYTDPAAQTHS
jgi:glycosyltransferase involved in cell wall biosynthesis